MVTWGNSLEAAGGEQAQQEENTDTHHQIHRDVAATTAGTAWCGVDPAPEQIKQKKDDQAAGQIAAGTEHLGQPLLDHALVAEDLDCNADDAQQYQPHLQGSA